MNESTQAQVIDAHAVAAKNVISGRMAIAKSFVVLSLHNGNVKDLVEPLNANADIVAIFGKASEETLRSRAECGRYLQTDGGIQWMAKGGNALALAKKIASAKSAGVKVAKVRSCLKGEDPIGSLSEAIKGKAETSEDTPTATATVKPAERLGHALDVLRGIGSISADDDKARNLLAELHEELARVTATVSQTMRPKQAVRVTSGA
jgi:hypothetical protein